jgi:hypothetical protein
MCCVPLTIRGLHRSLLFLALSKRAHKKFELGLSSFILISIVDSETVSYNLQFFSEFIINKVIFNFRYFSL